MWHFWCNGVHCQVRRSCQFHRLLALQPQDVKHHEKTYWHARHSSRLCPISANSIASQLVKNGANKRRDHHPHQQGGVRPTEGHNTKGIYYIWLFNARDEPGKSLILDSIFPEWTLRAGSAHKSWFCAFFTSCIFTQSKISYIWRRTLVVAIPKPSKTLGDP